MGAPTLLEKFGAQLKRTFKTANNPLPREEILCPSCPPTKKWHALHTVNPTCRDHRLLPPGKIQAGCSAELALSSSTKFTTLESLHCSPTSRALEAVHFCSCSHGVWHRQGPDCTSHGDQHVLVFHCCVLGRLHLEPQLGLQHGPVE